MTKLVVGCGYLGSRVADRWQKAGHRVYALTRRPDRQRHFRQRGLQPLLGDWTRPDTLPSLPKVDTLLCAVGWDRSSGQSVHQVYVEGLRNLLAVLPEEVGRVVYISSTGVYGQQDGQWVSERTPCEPRRTGGQACWEAEQLLLASNWADKTVILRLAGIYGPGRLPRWRDLAAGRPLTADPHGVLNLIHVDDAVRAVERAATISDIQLPGVFLISDGHPVRREEFYAELARLLQLPLPEFVPPGPGQRGSQRGRGQKKVSNERMIKQLGVVPLYSSYREGLAAIADS